MTKSISILANKKYNIANNKNSNWFIKWYYSITCVYMYANNKNK